MAPVFVSRAEQSKERLRVLIPQSSVESSTAGFWSAPSPLFPEESHAKPKTKIPKPSCPLRLATPETNSALAPADDPVYAAQIEAIQRPSSGSALMNRTAAGILRR